MDEIKKVAAKKRKADTAYRDFFRKEFGFDVDAGLIKSEHDVMLTRKAFEAGRVHEQRALCNEAGVPLGDLKRICDQVKSAVATCESHLQVTDTLIEALKQFVVQLHKVATTPSEHNWDGLCPDAVEGAHSRDPDCPACQVLIRADRVVASVAKDEASA